MPSGSGSGGKAGFGTRWAGSGHTPLGIWTTFGLPAVGVSQKAPLPPPVAPNLGKAAFLAYTPHQQRTSVSRRAAFAGKQSERGPGREGWCPSDAPLVPVRLKRLEGRGVLQHRGPGDAC